MHDLVISEVGPPIPLVFQHIYAKLSANLRGFSAEENRPCLTECRLNPQGDDVRRAGKARGDKGKWGLIYSPCSWKTPLRN